MGGKWLIRGLMIFTISELGWFVSVILNVVTLGKLRMAANVFGVVALAILPISIVLAIFDRRKKDE